MGSDRGRLTRREFIRGLAGAGLGFYVGGGGAFRAAFAEETRSQVFRVDQCPVHDGGLRHIGVDTLLNLLADSGLRFYKTAQPHPWGGAAGIIAADDIVLIKVNCQWKCRGTTNTDVLRGVIHRILGHPDGFTGEVVVFENGQGQGAFNGLPLAWNSYSSWPSIANSVHVNSEDETVLTVDHLVNTVFAGQPVSSYLLDAIRTAFIGGSEHAAHGYRKLTPASGSATVVSYPCFTTAAGNRIELREGRWTGTAHASNVKLINIPVLKDHDGTGMTGVLKHVYGILSMSDGASSMRHYGESGSQCGKMWSLVRIPDLNILDCIWTSHEQLRGYPESATRRTNLLLAGLDPVAIDYHASKHVLFPLGGAKASQHNPDTFAGLQNLLNGAQQYINANGGIAGAPARQGDANIEVISRVAAPASARDWALYS
jgi:hypothetical protein